MTDRSFPDRKPLRLSEYDYSTAGAYFITFCTHNREHTLSRTVGAIHESPALQLTEYGRIVDGIIGTLPPHLHAAVDRYVIMPNHIHLILVITQEDMRRAIRESPLQGRSVISKTVGYIKMNASKAIRARFGAVDVWQRGYHDHVIRNMADYEAIAAYIGENPIRWESDRLYTDGYE